MPVDSSGFAITTNLHVHAKPARNWEYEHEQVPAPSVHRPRSLSPKQVARRRPKAGIAIQDTSEGERLSRVVSTIVQP